MGKSIQRVLVTGGGGFIGSHIVRGASQWAPGVEVLAPLRRALDLTDFRAVREWFDRERPDAVIHCAALSRVNACAENPTLAQRVNVDLVSLLLEVASDVLFVHLSTDLVFDGKKGNYTETDAVAPLNLYAETKVAAEHLVQAHPAHLLLRTSLNYGTSTSGHRSFNEDIVDNWRAGKSRTFFNDEFRSPIPVVITARAIWELLQKQSTGLFHLGGAERMSRWEMAQLKLKAFPEFAHLAVEGSTSDYAGPPRAADTSLDCTKLQAGLSFELPRFSDWYEQNVLARK